MARPKGVPNKLTQGAKHAIWYVYELIDPRDGSVFYVGKGSGGRMDDHEKQARNGVCSNKCNKIREIETFDFNIVKKKVALFWCERAAFDAERDRISYYGTALTNQAGLPPPLLDVIEPIVAHIALLMHGKYIKFSDESSKFAAVTNRILPLTLRKCLLEDQNRTKEIFLKHGIAGWQLEQIAA